VSLDGVLGQRRDIGLSIDAGIAATMTAGFGMDAFVSSSDYIVSCEESIYATDREREIVASGRVSSIESVGRSDDVGATGRNKLN